MIVILSRLPTTDLRSLKIEEVLKDHFQNLDHLSEDIIQILNYPSLSEVYLTALLEDLNELSALAYLEYDFEELKQELHNLIKDVSIRYKQHKQKEFELTSVSFQKPDTIEFTFKTKRPALCNCYSKNDVMKVLRRMSK